MFDKIKKLKERGFQPDLIIDAGAYKGNWTKQMLNIYPEPLYFLFESINYTEFESMSSEKIKIFKVTLDSEKSTKNWYQMKNTGDSLFRENTKVFENCEILQKETTTLDDEISVSDFKRIFLKIDCQGAELEILKGARKVIENTEVILMETPFFGEWNYGAPSFFESIKFMNDIGFIPYEIAEQGIANLDGSNYLIHLDLIFIKKNSTLDKKVKNF